jgi:hypothetical protein
MVAFAAYMGWEIWRWQRGNQSMLDPSQFRRRLLGGALIELMLLIWVLANPLLAGHRPAVQLLYLSAAMLFTLLLCMVLMLLALQDRAFVVRQYSRWRGGAAHDLKETIDEEMAGQAASSRRGSNGKPRP